MSIINLLPEDYMQRRLQRRANLLCVVLFAVIMLGVGGAFAFSERSARNTRDVERRVDASYVDAARLLEQVRQLETQKGQMLRKAELTASLMERVPRSHLLAVVTNALPETACLTDFTLDRKKVVRAAAPADAKKPAKGAPLKVDQPVVFMEISGTAGTDVDVARFMANLARSPLASAVELDYTQEKAAENVTFREFKVRVELRSDVDVMSLPKPQAAQKRMPTTAPQETHRADAAASGART